MRASRIFATASAAALTFAALVVSSPAQATTGWPVPDNYIVATADGATKPLCDAFTLNYTSSNPLACVPSSPVQTKVDTGVSPCAGIASGGASANITLLAQWRGTNNKVSGEPYGYACVDTTFVSLNLNSSDPNWLTEVLFAQDLITWSSNTGGHAVSNLSDQELKAIYLCDATQLPSGDTTHTGAVKWSDLKNEGGTSTDEITAVLPQSGSVTRATWLSDIFGSSIPTSFKSCVVNGTFNNNPVEENEGTNAVFTSIGNPTHVLSDGNSTGYLDIVFPYDGADWLCQAYTSNCGPQGTVEGNLVLKNIDGKSPTKGSPPVLNIGGLNAFPSTYIRGLFAVVRNGCSQTSPCIATPTTPGSQWPVDITPLLGNGNNTGYICSTAGQNIVANYGFAKPINCGALLNSTPTPPPPPPTP